jgi:hypothetical protein
LADNNESRATLSIQGTITKINSFFLHSRFDHQDYNTIQDYHRSSTDIPK